jgi:uncharacterized protein with von Willebrand factor type A (vWA) domain
MNQNAFLHYFVTLSKGSISLTLLIDSGYASDPFNADFEKILQTHGREARNLQYLQWNALGSSTENLKLS